MSVAEFGLRSQRSFITTLPQMRLEPLAGAEARLRLLLDLTKSMVAQGELNDVLREVTIGARRLMQSDFAILGLLDSQSGRLRVNAFEFADDTVLDAEAVNSFGEALASHLFSMSKPWTGISADLVVGVDLNQERLLHPATCNPGSSPGHSGVGQARENHLYARRSRFPDASVRPDSNCCRELACCRRTAKTEGQFWRGQGMPRG